MADPEYHFISLPFASSDLHISVTDCEILDHICYSSVQVSEVKGEDVVCRIKNSATLAGPLYTLHVAGIHIDLPTLTDKDKEA